MMVLVVSLRTRPVNTSKVEFERVKERRRRQNPSPEDPEYTKLFGNKALRYTDRGLGVTTTVVGYLRADQLSGRASSDALQYQ
jgi:hypothetical protein